MIAKKAKGGAARRFTSDVNAGMTERSKSLCNSRWISSERLIFWLINDERKEFSKTINKERNSIMEICKERTPMAPRNSWEIHSQFIQLKEGISQAYASLTYRAVRKKFSFEDCDQMRVKRGRTRVQRWNSGGSVATNPLLSWKQSRYQQWVYRGAKDQNLPTKKLLN